MNFVKPVYVYLNVTYVLYINLCTYMYTMFKKSVAQENEITK